MLKRNATHFLLTALSYVALLSLGSYMSLPGGVDFPNFAFFLSYAALPCLISLLLVFLSLQRSLWIRFGAVVVSLFVFALLWHFQLRLAIDAAAHLGRLHQGLVSNFVAFSYSTFKTSIVLACIFLMAFTVLYSRLQLAGIRREA